MSSRAGLFDFEFNKKSIFDPEVNSKGIFDPDFSTTASGASVVLTGTITASVTEADIVAGGKTAILTLTGDTWIVAGALNFDLQRQNIINGFDSAQSEALGWDLVPKALQGVAGVVRTSDTVVTITWDAFPTYNITATETITCIVPASALAGGLPLTATPTFTVSAIVTGIVGAIKMLLMKVGF